MRKLAAPARGLIFRRPPTQVGLGVAAGCAIVGVAPFVLSGEGQLTGDGLSLTQVALLVMYAVLMLAVCLLTCVVPTRRALRIEPSEALRAE